MATTAPAELRTAQPVAARRELAARTLARRRLIPFCQYVDRKKAAEYGADHLTLVADYLERALSGQLFAGLAGDGARILAITTPPRHWKSSLISRKLPAFFVGQRLAAGQPHQFIISSYGASLAESHSGGVLELIESAAYQRLFPGVRASQRSRAVSEWSIAGEGYPTGVAAGVGGGITGQGADLLIVDDPIKDRAEANSAADRERKWDWWRDVARSRLNPGGLAVIVMTRWHDDDLIGRLLAMSEQDYAAGAPGEQLIMLRLPALAESERERRAAAKLGLPYDAADPLGRQPGEALWPAQFSADWLRATRRQYPLTFDALYQGTPRPASGFLVGRSQFKIMPSEPTADIRWVWSSDWAITEREAAPRGARGPDYTAVGKVGLWLPGGDRHDARLVISSVQRGQLDPHAARQLVKRAVLSSGGRIPLVTGQANIDKVLLAWLRSDADLVGVSVRRLKRRDLPGDKVTRAQPWLEMVHAGAVYLVEGSWNEAFLAEAESFPRGVHDDQIDMVSIGVHALGLARRSRQASSARLPGFGV